MRGLPGTPDVVYGKARLTVFVHGCYWHQCPRCARNRTPKTNALYWEAKFAANAERDARQLEQLGAMGWRTLVLWECGLKDLPSAVERGARGTYLPQLVAAGRSLRLQIYPAYVADTWNEFKDAGGVEHLAGIVGGAAPEVAEDRVELGDVEALEVGHGAVGVRAVLT